MNNKKKYEAPEMKVHQVKPTSIICTSGYSTQQLDEEQNLVW